MPFPHFILMTTTALLDQIVSFMDDADRHYDRVSEGGGLIVTQISGDDGTWSVYVQITDDQEARRVVVHGRIPAHIPESNRLKVAEMLTRTNYELILGNFELNLEDGEVLFKTTLDLAGGQLTQAMFERAYQLNAQCVNEYYGQILRVGFGDARTQITKTVTHRIDGALLQ